MCSMATDRDRSGQLTDPGHSEITQLVWPWQEKYGGFYKLNSNSKSPGPRMTVLNLASISLTPLAENFPFLCRSSNEIFRTLFSDLPRNQEKPLFVSLNKAPPAPYLMP